MSLIAVFTLSVSTLSYELLLTRFFTIAHGSHLSFIVIGIAMFGIAAGGLVALAPSRGHPRVAEGARDRDPFFIGLGLLGSFSTVGSFLVLKILPLDYLRFPVDRLQPLYLMAAWLLLSIPFFASGLATCTAYAAEPARSGSISAASLLGSAAGSLLPVLTIPLAGEGMSVAMASFVPLLPGAFGISRRSDAELRGIVLAIAIGLAAALVWKPGLFAIFPSPYRTLSQLLQAPGARLTATSATIRGRVEEVESPLVRFAPGMSLSWQGSLPAQNGIVVDGDVLTVGYQLAAPAAASRDFARSTHAFAPYALAGRASRCLVILRDGGLAAACASAAGADRIDVVVDEPVVARRLRQIYQVRGLSVVADNPRSFLARRGPLYDTIVLEDWGSAIPGMAALSEDFLLTVDAFRGCWRRTTDTGIVSVSRRLVLPPSDSVRLFATALRALREEGVANPADHLAVIRSWDSCTLLASRAPIRGEGRERLRLFADSLGFDLDYLPGLLPGESNRFSRYERPYFAEAYAAILSDTGWLDRYFLDAGPQTDDRPFPSRFLRWLKIGEFLRVTGERRYTLFLSGEAVALAGLAVALAVSLLLLLLPVRARALRARGSAPLFTCVAGCGVGYLLLEIFLIDSLQLLFSSQPVALTIALGGLLVSSSLGSLFTERLSRGTLRRTLPIVALVVGLAGAALPLGLRLLLPLPSLLRGTLCIALLVIPGFSAGIPFPSAMRTLARSSTQRMSSWAVNGCASVVAAALSPLIAMGAGIRILAFIACASYAAAAAAYAFASVGPDEGPRYLHPVNRGL